MPEQLPLANHGPPIPAEPDYLYSVIYSFDCPKTQWVRNFNPPTKQRKLWQLTEQDDASDEYEDLCNCNPDEPCLCGFRRVYYRKWCAMLTQEQFDEFVNLVGLCAEDIETMGSIGAPGFGFGCAPAISFTLHADLYAGAYVTSCPKEGDEFWPTEDAWKKVRRQVIEHYQ